MKKSLLVVLLALALVLAFAATSLAAVDIDGPSLKADGSQIIPMTSNNELALDNKATKLYFKITGLAEGDKVTGAKLVSGETEIYEASVTAKQTSLTIKAGGESFVYTLVRPVLDLVYMNDEAKTKKADKVTFEDDEISAFYVFNEDWSKLFFMPVSVNEDDAYTTFDVEIDDDAVTDDDGWYEQKLKNDIYTVSIKVVVDVAGRSFNQYYYVYPTAKEYKIPELNYFKAGSDDDVDDYKTVIGSDTLYVFVPYDKNFDLDDDMYFHAQTGNKDDVIFYGDSTEEFTGKDKYCFEGDGHLDKITVVDENDFANVYKVVVVAGAKNAEDDATLDELSLKSGKSATSQTNTVELSPKFDPKAKNQDYTASVPTDQTHAKVTLATSDDAAYVFINGECITTGSKKDVSAVLELAKGANKFEILVVAEDCETTQLYTLTINQGSSTNLKALTVGGLLKAMSPAFDVAKLNYIGYTTAEAITLTATAEDATASVTVSGAGSKSAVGSVNETFALKEGINIFTVTVYQKGASATKAYTVSIYRVPAVRTIKVSQQKITVNGTSKTLTAYNINGNNFLQLRDVAMLLNGTDKTFAINFNDATQSAYLNTGSAYTPNGTENAAISTYKAAAVSTQNFFLNNTQVYPIAFNIDGSNYVMLRDLGALLDFGITFNAATNSIAVTTSTPYVPGR